MHGQANLRQRVATTTRTECGTHTSYTASCVNAIRASQMQPARTPLGIVEALELVNDTAHYPWKRKVLFGSTMRKAIHMVCGVRTWSMIGAIDDPDANVFYTRKQRKENNGITWALMYGVI